MPQKLKNIPYGIINRQLQKKEHINVLQDLYKWQHIYEERLNKNVASANHHELNELLVHSINVNYLVNKIEIEYLHIFLNNKLRWNTEWYHQKEMDLKTTKKKIQTDYQQTLGRLNKNHNPIVQSAIQNLMHDIQNNYNGVRLTAQKNLIEQSVSTINQAIDKEFKNSQTNTMMKVTIEPDLNIKRRGVKSAKLH